MNKIKFLVLSVLVSGSISYAQANLDTAYQCQSGNFLTEDHIRAEVLLEAGYESDGVSRGLVLLEHWSLNPEGNHAFAPDMIFLKDFFRATVRNQDKVLSLDDPSGADLKIEGEIATLVLKGNRNVKRSFTVEKPLTMKCQRVHSSTSKAKLFDALY